MSTTEELLARLVNLENEAVQARQRQGSAEQALAAAQQRNPAVILRRQCTYPVNWSHRHAHTGQAEDVHWSASGMDNLAIHVQDVCVCYARKNERRFRVGDTERLGSCDRQ